LAIPNPKIWNPKCSINGHCGAQKFLDFGAILDFIFLDLGCWTSKVYANIPKSENLQESETLLFLNIQKTYLTCNGHV
jgi:hypothetical protein